ncbi:TcaA 3rd/4th domain-containing protein [Mechercharimyces sp. CAU 1602]|uniref:TcaA 3rd/4th domain-containing protein n=1 Tax=Mechercharimyces sp. CAU 1602 TaxID=2973933 RepID=UPI002161BC95|nr:hypothetical protein [Mechercharimyces sp. CAU 1602]MCS1352549.1 hypothetical protein [Mechercharimyces sp. CAU 1602]
MNIEKAKALLFQTKEKATPFISKNKKVLYPLGGLLAIIVILLIFGSDGHSDPQRMVREFEMALAKGDVETVMDMVVSDDDKIEINREQIQQFVDYTQEHDQFYSGISQILNAQAAYYADSEDIMHFRNGMTSKELLKAGPYYVKKNEIPILPDSYSIGVRSYHIKLKTNSPEVNLKVAGKEVFKTKEGKLSYTYGPVMPGIYQVSADKKFEYAQLSTENEVILFGDYNKPETSNLNLNGEMVTISSQFTDETFYVNGKKVGKVSEYKEFGPVTKDGSIKIYGEMKCPWGTCKSPTKTIDEDTKDIDITPHPFSDKKSQKPITKLINDYTKQWIEARKTRNANIITTLADDELNDEIKHIDYMKEFERTFKGSAIGTRIDYGTVELTKEGDRYQVKLLVEFHSKYEEYSKYSHDDDDPLVEHINKKQVTLTYFDEKKKWLISGFDSSYGYGKEMNGKMVVKSKFK